MSNATPKIVGYVRVSTARQGESGLGLEAQLTAIQNHAKGNGSNVEAIYREVESGTHNDRPQLAKAIAHAKRSKAKLVIAKLDRLGRNVHFVSGLMEAKVDFIACDNPFANKLTIQIMACIAEHEAEAISQRTKAALAAAKARGTLLGSARPNHWEGKEDIRLAAAAKARKAAAAKAKAVSAPLMAEVRPIATALRTEGASLQTIADKLNAEGFSTARGAAWAAMQVSRVIGS